MFKKALRLGIYFKLLALLEELFDHDTRTEILE
jgi:hypothetical protein